MMTASDAAASATSMSAATRVSKIWTVPSDGNKEAISFCLGNVLDPLDRIYLRVEHVAGLTKTSS